MSRRKIDPLREITPEEHLVLVQLSWSQVAPAVEVTRAKLLLAVARGDDYQTPAYSVGRRSGDAVSQLVARFNAEDLAALTPWHGGGRSPVYDQAMPTRILNELKRTPAPEADGSRLVSQLKPPQSFILDAWPEFFHLGLGLLTSDLRTVPGVRLARGHEPVPSRRPMPR